MTLPRLVRSFCNSGRKVVTNPLLWTAAKGQYIKDAGLAGFAMWEAGGDSSDILLDAIRLAVGFQPAKAPHVSVCSNSER